MNNTYELTSDLAKKLSLYTNSTTHNDDKSLSEDQVSLMVKLLLQSNTKRKKLNRDIVTKLLKGEINGYVDGQEAKIAKPVDITQLESHYMIRFINEELIIPVYVPNTESFKGELGKQLQALKWLRKVKENYRYIELSKAQQIYETHLLTFPNTPKLLECSGLQLNNDDELCINLDNKYIVEISSKLWEELSFMSDSYERFKSWFGIMFEYTHVLDIRFTDESNRKVFLEEATKYILNEDDYKRTWRDEVKVQIIEHDLYNHSLFYQANADGESECRKEFYSDGLNFFLSDLPETCESYFDAYIFWQKTEVCDFISHCSGVLHALCYLIIQHDKARGDMEASYPYVQKLINGCLERPRLAQYLFYIQNTPHLTAFMLRKKSTVALAMHRITTFYNNFPNYIYGSQTNLKQQWNDMIWGQALEIFFSHFSPHQAQEIETKTFLSGLLLILSQDSIRNNRHEENDNSRHLKATLTFLEKTILKNFSNPTLSLLEILLPQIANYIITSTNARSNSYNFPFPEWFLLFWLLEKSLEIKNREVENRSVLDGVQETITDCIINSYQAILCNKLDKKTYDEELIFDKFNWGLLFRLSSVNRQDMLIRSLNHSDLIKHYFDKSKNISVYGIRTHLRLLIFLYRQLDDKTAYNAETISTEIMTIFKNYCVNQMGLDNIFDDTIDDSGYNPINLWSEFTRVINSFPYKTYDTFITSVLDSNMSLLGLLKLYNNTPSENGRKRIKEKLESLNEIKSDDFFWLPHITKAFIIAANNGLENVKKLLIDRVGLIQRKDFQKEFSALIAKNRLSSIFRDNSLTAEEKIEQINKFEIPDNIDRNENYIDKECIKSIEEQKQFLTALLYYDSAPQKTYKYLNYLCQSSNKLLYASNRLSARLKLMGNVKTISVYQSALNEWLEFKETNNIDDSQIGIFEARLILDCYHNMNDTYNFDKFWDSLAPDIQMDLDLIEIRSDYLQKYGLNKLLHDYIDKIKRFHQDIPKEYMQLLENIEKGTYKHNGVNSRVNSTSEILTNESKSDKELRDVWNEIRGSIVEKQARVCSNDSDDRTPEKFVLSHLEPIITVLLDRSKNLQRQISNHKAKLEEENIINDWLVSLFKHKVRYLNWEVEGEARKGSSASGKSVGELDLVCSQNDYPIMLLEAFRLNSVDKNCINEHLNKIDGYNASGCQVIVLMVYIMTAEFSKFCVNYIDHVSKIDYKGFDKAHKLPQEIEDIRPRSTKYRIYKEIRIKNERSVSVFHILMDFKS